jgi:diguanylate cyclase (GGDEF)-like protein/PAS domain S-box-containing protein
MIAETNAASLNGEMLQSLTTSIEDTGTLGYFSLKNRLEALVKADREIIYTYIYTLRNNQLIHLVDSEPEHSLRSMSPGSEMKADDVDLKRSFEKGISLVTPRSMEAWGKTISIMAPMRHDQNGTMLAVFVMVYPEETFYTKSNLGTIQTSLIVVALFLLSIAVFIIFVNFKALKEKIKENTLAHEKISKSERQFREYIENAPHGVLIIDERGQFLDSNPAAKQILGRTQNELVAMGFDDLLSQQDHDAGLSPFQELIESGRLIADVACTKDTGEKCCWSVSAIRLSENRFLAFVVDITERKRLEDLLFKKKEQLETTLLSIGDGVISTDIHENVKIMNKVAENLTGWTQEEALGVPFSELGKMVNEITRDICRNPIEQVLESKETVELSNHTILISKHGLETPIEYCAAPIWDAQKHIHGVVLVIRDCSQKKKRLEKILYLSNHDHLTGLHNRRSYEIEAHKLDDKRFYPLSLVIADVNGLKLTNDAYGHKAGDELLQKFSHLLIEGLHGTGVIARIGGDEFVILLPRTDVNKATDYIERISNSIQGERIHDMLISVSFGLAVKDDSLQDMDAIFKIAEDAMYRNKLTENPDARRKSIDMLLQSLFIKSAREMKHSTRVGELSATIASRMRFSNDAIEEIRMAGIMHDIGKIAIDDKILNKPASLDALEYQEMKRHPEIGYNILSATHKYSAFAEYVLCHHERWDGKGYPRGLRGNDIPLQARIITVADSYDAMISKRTYKEGLDSNEVVVEMIRCAGTQFDPDIAKLFVEKVLGARWALSSTQTEKDLNLA